MDPFTGTLVRLREYRDEDIADARRLFSDPEVAILIGNMLRPPMPLWDEERFVHSIGANHDDYTFAVETLEGVYIGGCGVNEWDPISRCATVGISIADKAYWGRGYGTDAMQTLLRYLFLGRGAHRVELSVFADNPRAIRCYEKCGFVHEGVKRNSRYRDGAYSDSLVMGMLRDEYDRRMGGEYDDR